MKKINLSEWRREEFGKVVYPESKIKEAIKLLKENLKIRCEKIKLWEADALMKFIEDINEIFGKDLCEEGGEDEK